MEIPLLILVLQIGFNAALNNRGYSSNPVIPSPPFINSGQTRRLAETDTYLQLSSRGLPNSDEESESGHSGSFEDYSYRSVRQLQRHPNQRKNQYLRYNSPSGRMNSNNQEQSLNSDPYLRRPYFRNGVSNLRPDQISQNYRKANDDSSLEVSSLESTNSEDASRLGEEATYLRSLLSLMEQQNNRKGESRKYYGQENSLNIGVSPTDNLNVDEDNLPNSLNNRRNNNPYNRQADSILLVADKDKSDEIPIENPTLKSPELTGRRYNKSYRRNFDPIIRRFNRKSNKNANLDSQLNDDTGKLTVLRLASLEDLNLESPLLRSGNNRKNNHRNFLRLSLSPDNKLILDEGVTSDLSEILSETLDGLHLAPVDLRSTGLPNNKYSRRNNNGLNVEENSLRLESLHFPKPASPLGRYRGNLRRHGNHTRQLLKKISPLRRYRNPVNLSSNKILRTHGNHTLVLKKLLDEDTAKNLVRSLRTHGNHTREVPKTESDGDTIKTIEPGLRTHSNHTRQELKKLFDEDTAKILVPYHEGKGKKLLSNRKHENQNNNRNDGGWPDEFNLDTLFAFRKEDNLADGLTNQDNLSTEPSLMMSSDEISPKYDDKLHLEFPWNDSLSPDYDKGKLLLRTLKKNGKSKDTTDTLNLEFPWNIALSPDSANAKSKLRTDEKKGNSKDTSDTLHLEFPWNGHLISNASKGKSQLRNDNDKTDKNKDTTEALHLEFPWNDALSPDSDKSTPQLRIDGKKDETEDTIDTLQLEFPWNGAPSPDSDRGKIKLRIDEQKDEINDTNDTLKLEFPWNDSLSSNTDKENSKLRTDEQKDVINNTLNLEPPWNGALSPDGDKGKSKLRSDGQIDETKNTTNTLNLEFPWNDILSPNSDKSEKTLRSKNDTKDALNLVYPWNGQLSPDSNETGGIKTQSNLRSEKDRQNKEPQDDLKLEFPWNGQTSPDKPASQQKLRLPDPFYVHPYLRNRNVNKHPNYFRQSYDVYSRGRRLDNLKNKRSNLRYRQSKRRRYDDLEVIGLNSRSSEEDPSDLITFPEDRRPNRLRSKENNTPNHTSH